MAIPGTPEWYEEQKRGVNRQRKKTILGNDPISNFGSSPLFSQSNAEAKRAKQATATASRNTPGDMLKRMFGGSSNNSPASRSPGGRSTPQGMLHDMFGGNQRPSGSRNPPGMGVLKQGQLVPGPFGNLIDPSLLPKNNGGGRQEQQGPPQIGDNYVANMGELPTFGKTLADYLKIYGDGSSLAAPVLKDIDARSAALKERGSEGDAQIASAYAQLQKSLQLAKEDEGERYKEAQAAAGENGAAAQQAIAAAREGSLKGRDTVRANLGMEDIPASDSEGYASEAGAQDISRSATSGLSQQDYLQNIGNARQDYMGSNKTAAGFAGAENQSALQRDLMDRLGMLDSEKAGVLSDAQLNAQQLAMQAYNSDYGAFTNERDFAANRDDTAWGRAMDETNLYSNYQQLQMDAQQRAQQAQIESQTQQQKMQQQMAEQQQKNTPAYAQTADRLRQNLGQSLPQDTINNVLNYYAKAASDPERFPIDVDELISMGLSPQDAVFAMQEGREYLRAYA